MTTTTAQPASAPSALDQSFRDVCASHGFDNISVGFTTRDELTFVVWVHRGVECANGYGGTIAEAMGKAIAKMRATDTLADEALPELAA